MRILYFSQFMSSYQRWSLQLRYIVSRSHTWGGALIKGWDHLKRGGGGGMRDLSELCPVHLGNLDMRISYIRLKIEQKWWKQDFMKINSRFNNNMICQFKRLVG